MKFWKEHMGLRALFIAGFFFAGLALMLPMGMVGTSILFIILGALEISAYPLMDAMAVQFIQAGMKLSYSFGRGLGSLSYALVCVFLGFQAGRFGVESTLGRIVC